MNEHYHRALLLFNRGCFHEAESELRAALAAGEKSADIHAMLGLCLLKADFLERAKTEIKEALKIEPTSAYAFYAMSYVEEILPVHYEKTKAHAAIRSVFKAIELDPNNARYFVRLAEIRQNIGQWKKSIEPARQALRLEPDNVMAAILLAEALLKLGLKNEAHAVTLHALELDPEASLAHAGMGWTLLHVGDRERATQFFQEALRLNADSEWAQAGILECAKHRYQLYRLVHRLKHSMTNPRMVFKTGLIIVFVLALLSLARGSAWLDKVIGGWPETKGPALFLGVLFFICASCVFFFDHFFTWLVRQDMASKTRLGEQKKMFAKDQTTAIIIGILLGAIAIGLGFVSNHWVGLVIGLLPGLFCIGITLKELPYGKLRTGFILYSIFILILGMAIGFYFYDFFKRQSGNFLILPLFVPTTPLCLTVIRSKKREKEKLHNQAISQLSQKGNQILKQ